MRLREGGVGYRALGVGWKEVGAAYSLDRGFYRGGKFGVFRMGGNFFYGGRVRKADVVEYLFFMFFCFVFVFFMFGIFWFFFRFLSFSLGKVFFDFYLG